MKIIVRITLLLGIAMFLSCATAEYNPSCLRQCERSNRECVQNCSSLRMPVPEGERRTNLHYRSNNACENCSILCEKSFRKCKKRCEIVLTIDSTKGGK